MAATTTARLYAVRTGRRPGVYATAKNAFKQVHEVKNGTMRGGFRTVEEAQAFVAGTDPVKPMTRKVRERPVAYRGMPKLDAFLNPFSHTRRSRLPIGPPQAPATAAAPAVLASRPTPKREANPRRVYFQGATRPGHVGGAGYVVMDGSRLRELGWLYMPSGASSSNVAHYRGFLAALASGKRHFGAAADFVLCGDAQLVVRQVNQEIRVLAQPLMPLYAEVKRAKPAKVKVVLVPRAANVASDILARFAMDLKRSGSLVDAPQFQTLGNTPSDADVKRLIVDLVE